jgi:hypothetical protein
MPSTTAFGKAADGVPPAIHFIGLNRFAVGKERGDHTTSVGEAVAEVFGGRVFRIVLPSGSLLWLLAFPSCPLPSARGSSAGDDGVFRPFQPPFNQGTFHDPLRKRMIDEMELRNFSPKTVNAWPGARTSRHWQHCGISTVGFVKGPEIVEDIRCPRPEGRRSRPQSSRPDGR